MSTRPKDGRPAFQVCDLELDGNPAAAGQTAASVAAEPTDTALGVTTLAEGRFAFVDAQGKLVVWDATGGILHSTVDTRGDVNIGAVLIASSGRTGRPHLAVQSGLMGGVWEIQGSRSDLQFKRMFTLPRGQGIVWSMAWSPDGQNLAVGTSDGQLAVWSLNAIMEHLDGLGLSP